MRKCQVAVIAGSESDLPVMEKACEVLKELGLSFRLEVASAHRTPRYLKTVVMECEAAVSVYIAGAGMAAHLPGVIAGMTVKPVIGVPMSSKLLGLDSLLSIVQMPKGVPVAAVAVDGAANAALLAAQILALGDKQLAAKLVKKRKNFEAEAERQKYGRRI
jgi:5-(carboxyamino)imidazole ribonucleotide mutase